MIQRKRGLSGVIVTILMIGLSIAAIIVVWAVIRNIVNSGSGNIGIDQYTIDLKLQKVVQSTNSADITIKRNPGKGTLSGLKFIVSDGTNTQTFEQDNINFNELETQTFTIPYSSLIKTIEVAPIISVQGKALLQNVVNTLDLPATDAVKNMPGLVSWYRFEGNANDEMGRNNGVISDPSLWLVNGRFGKAYRFTNAYAIISVPDSPSLRLENSNFTVIVWVNKTSTSLSIPYGPILTKGDIWYNSEKGYYFGLQRFFNNSLVRASFGTDSFFGMDGINLTLKNWYQVSASQQVNSPARTIRSYVNGILGNQTTNPNVPSTNSSGYNLVIGANGENFPYEPFNGIIDEVMIFNRTLNDSEIKALYNLDLSA